MAAGVKEIIKIVAPVALDALVSAAEALIAGAAFARERSVLEAVHNTGVGASRLAAADGDPGTAIDQDTTTYITTNFASTYGYYYQGLTSKPTTGALPVAAAQDILVWDPGQKGLSDIQAYLQQVFKDSLAPSDSIEIANNLAQLFQARFAEQSLDWTPFNKRFNMADKLIVDTYMVTASAHDASNNPAGICNYCFVAYNMP